MGVSSYWILDGESKAYELKDQLKAWGASFNWDFKAWQISTPDKAMIKLIRSMGLVVQPK